MIYQQIHKRCGGYLFVSKLDNELLIVCSICVDKFKYSISLPMNKEWRNVTKKDGMTVIGT